MMASRTVTTPSMMARRTAPMVLTMAIRQAPMEWKTAWICEKGNVSDATLRHVGQARGRDNIHMIQCNPF